MGTLYVGIDIAKDRSTAHGIDGDSKSCFSLSFTMNGAGFNELLTAIESNCDDLANVVAAMESTACYHINLYSFLAAKGLKAIVINPLLISNYAKLSLRKTKTDKKDARTIACFIRAHHDSVSQLAVSQEQQDLRDMARESEALCHQISAMKVEILRLLQSIFPEIQSICSPFSKVMLHFIQRFPSARLIAMAKPAALARTLKEKSFSERMKFTPEEIIKIAKASIATVSPAKEFILSGKIETLVHLQKRRDDLIKALTRCCEATVVEDLHIVTSIDGINNKTATALLAEIGTIQQLRLS